MTINYRKRDGSRSTVALDNATLAVIPDGETNIRGFVFRSIIALYNFLDLDAVPLTTDGMIHIMADELSVSPSAVVKCAVAWYSGSSVGIA